MPELTIYHDGQPVLREGLVAPLTIGGSDECDIRLLDSVAPLHARIEMADEEFILVEQEGTVFVNGERIQGSHRLKEGDFFGIGSYRFQFSRSPIRREERDQTRTATKGGSSHHSLIPTLVISSPVQKKYRRPKVVLGRSQASDLVISNDYVSSRHAEIFCHDGTYLIRDLHSRNGTYVNDLKVTEHPLPVQGTIRLGRALINYHIESPVETKAKETNGIPVPGPAPRSQRLIVGKSDVFKKLIEKLRRTAPTDESVLLLGETGVGKDLLAHYLHHEHPKRRQHPLVIVNCATIPPTLSDSQLFGHVKGAFTGAVNDHKGFFQQAHHGTLFLDEIGELPLESQARLLRVMEDGRIRPVGGDKEISVDVRLIFATNRDLSKDRQEKKFRDDLFERFDRVLTIPPLRERSGDVLPLATYFLSQHAPYPLELSPEAKTYLENHPWPGNIRSLKRLIRTGIQNAISRGSSLISVSDLEVPSHSTEGDFSAFKLREMKRRALPDALRQHQGNISHAAKALGVSRVTFHKWMREDGI